MPVTNVHSRWVSGNLEFYPATGATSPQVKFVEGVALVSGESTTGVTVAAGSTMLYGYGVQKTNALTGTLRGVRGNASTLIASAAGTIIGVAGRAANGSSTTATDGVNAGTLRGGDFLIAGVGKSGPAVITSAQGVFVQLDIDAANLTITDARGVYVNVQSGNASANTLTACNLEYLEYESVTGTAPAINSAIKIACVGGTAGMTQLIDAATAKPVAVNTNQNILMKFLDTTGTVRYLVYDPDSATAVSVTNSVS